jgi:hypothetical protein
VSDKSSENEGRRLIEDYLPIEVISKAASSHSAPEGSHG